jgi:hypothetical protein
MYAHPESPEGKMGKEAGAVGQVRLTCPDGSRQGCVKPTTGR